MKKKVNDYLSNNWKKEMMRLPKEIIISLLEKELLKNSFESFNKLSNEL